MRFRGTPCGVVTCNIYKPSTSLPFHTSPPSMFIIHRYCSSDAPCSCELTVIVTGMLLLLLPACMQASRHALRHLTCTFYRAFLRFRTQSELFQSYVHSIPFKNLLTQSPENLCHLNETTESREAWLSTGRWSHRQNVNTAFHIQRNSSWPSLRLKVRRDMDIYTLPQPNYGRESQSPDHLHSLLVYESTHCQDRVGRSLGNHTQLHQEE